MNKTDQTLSVDGEKVVTATVAEGRFVAKWANEWEAWTEYSSSAEVQALCTKAAETLQQNYHKGRRKRAKREPANRKHGSAWFELHPTTTGGSTTAPGAAVPRVVLQLAPGMSRDLLTSNCCKSVPI